MRPQACVHATARGGRVSFVPIYRLGETHPELTERAAALRHTMPPRWGGAFALLDASPAADVAVFVHYGLDGLRGLRSILRPSLCLRMW